VPEPIPAFRVYAAVVDDLLLGSGKSIEDLSTSYAPVFLSTRMRMDVGAVGDEACALRQCQGRNVLGVIPGRDPRYADQVIILGAHYDHLGQTPDLAALRCASSVSSGEHGGHGPA